MIAPPSVIQGASNGLMPLRTSILIVASIAQPVHAQWLNPTAGVPLTADGRADLNAPAPRTADGKPDLSGMRDIEHNNGWPPETCFDRSIGRKFLNIGSSLKDGLPYRPWAEALMRERVATLRKDDPHTHYLPIGIVRLHTIPLMKKIRQSRGLIVILNELLTGYRQIFTDGRPLFTAKLNQFIVLNSAMIDAFCLENEKSTAHFVVGT
jgi:hypothetical protein